MAVDPESAFSAIPSSLAADLLGAFRRVLKNYSEHRWEPSELNGGKLCEAVFTVVEGFLSGKYEQRARKPKNMLSACNALEGSYPSGPRSARIQIPRMIVALYEIRNNRGVGHAGGDIDPNHMDATAVLYMSKWIVAELVRLLHGLSTDEATELVDLLVERETSLVWRGGDTRRVLAVGLTQREGTLLLLAGVASASDTELAAWLEVGRLADYRSKVLKPLHKARLIEFESSSGRVQLLPPGVEAAEGLAAKLSELKL